MRSRPHPPSATGAPGRAGSCRRHGRWLVTVLAAGLAGGCAHFEARPLAPEQTAAAFGARSLADASLRAFLEANHVAAPGPQQPWDLKQLTLAAFYFQPGLAEARAQLLAAQAAQVTAAARPNPSLSLTPGYDSGIPGSTSPWIVPLSFDVPLETAGKRGYRMAQARALAEAARWSVVAAVWQVRSRVRAALLDLHAAQESESVLGREEAAQNHVVRLLEGQLAAGVVSSYEVTQARIAIDATRLARQQAAAQVRQARVQLAGALGVPLTALDGCRFSFAAFGRFPRQLTAPEVRREALLNRADVRGALADYAASQAALQLEIANQYPDVHLGPGYAWNTGSAGDSEWDLGLSLTLPILDRNQGPIAEAKAQRAVAAAHFLTVQAQALNDIEGALTAYHSALQQVATAGAMQQNLQRRLNSVRAQVQAGEAEPLTVANAEVEFAGAAQSRLDALVRAQQALGQLEDAVQSPLTLSPDAIEAAGRNFSEGAK
jgi:outer membrane protein, heavy metal efflux system